MNFALFFLGVAATAAGTLWSAPPDRDRTYYTFVIILLVTLIAGVVMLVLWWFIHSSTRTLLADIKSQMPAEPGNPRGCRRGHFQRERLTRSFKVGL